MTIAEISALKEYVSALETENQSKVNEQAILYRQIDHLKRQLAQMDQYYFANRQLRQQNESLQQQIQAQITQYQLLQEEIMALRAEQHQKELFEDEEQVIEELKEDLQASQQRENNLRQMLELEKTMLTEQKNYNRDLKKIIESKEEELLQLKQKLTHAESSSSHNISHSSQDIETLVFNYEQLEQVTFEREERIRELEKYVDQLEFQFESVKNSLQAKEIEIRQLENELKFLGKHSLGRQSKYFTAPKSHIFTPRWRDKDQLSVLSGQHYIKDSHKQNLTMIGNRSELPEIRDKSQRGSNVSSDGAGRLQVRNAILRRQNEMLLKTLADNC